MLLVCSLAGDGTTIYVHASADSIVLAADSKLGGQTPKGSPTTVCKVHWVGNVFFATTGIHSTQGFETDQFAADAIKGGGNLDALIDRFRDAVTGPLTSIIHDSINTAIYRRWMTGSPVVEIVMATFDNGVASFRTWALTLTFNGDITSYSGRVCRYPQGDCDLLMGDVAAVQRRDSADPFEAARIRQTPIEAAKTFLGLEVKAFPDVVGPPISILEITSNNAHWIEGYQGTCPNVPSTQRATPKSRKK